MGEGTPYSFVFVEVKVVVLLKKMNQLNIFDDLVLGVCEGAETFVIALVDVVGVECAELGFVPVGVVELFELVVGKLAIFVVAFLFSANKMIVLDVGGSAFVLVVVVVETSFSFVIF